MASTAYIKASRWWGLWIGLCLAGVAGLYLTMFFLIGSGLDRQLGLWTVAVALLPVVLTVATGSTIMARRNRRRIGGVAARLEAHGFAVTENPTEAERTAFCVSIAHLLPSLDVRTGAVGVQWCAVQREGSVKALIWEHQFITGSGKSTQEHHRTVMAWPAGHPDLRDPGLATATWFFMGQYSGFIRRGVRKRELQLPEFADVAKTWSLLGDATTAARFLTPGVRRVLQRSPRDEVWCAGAGFVCCCFNATLDADNMERFLGHGREVLASIGE